MKTDLLIADPLITDSLDTFSSLPKGTDTKVIQNRYTRGVGGLTWRGELREPGFRASGFGLRASLVIGHWSFNLLLFPLS